MNVCGYICAIDSVSMFGSGSVFVSMCDSKCVIVGVSMCEIVCW